MTQFTPSIKRVGSIQAPEPTQTTLKSRLQKAKSLVKEKRFEEALAEVEMVLKADPNNLAAHQAAGNLKIKLKRKDEALTHFQAILRLDPRKTKAYLKSAKIYLDQDRLDKSLEQCLAAAKIDPKLTAAYVGAGQVLVRQKNYDEAVKQLSAALRLNPRLLAARQQLALAYSKQHKYSEAVAQLKATLRIEPKNVIAHAGLGRIYLLLKDFSAAREAYQEAIKLKPEGSVSIHLGLSEALIEENRLEEAKQVLSDIPQKDQDSARLHKLWGDLYKRQGLFREATEEYQAATLLVSDADSLDELGDIDFTADLDDSQWEELAEAYSAKTSDKIAEKRSQI